MRIKLFIFSSGSRDERKQGFRGVKLYGQCQGNLFPTEIGRRVWDLPYFILTNTKENCLSAISNEVRVSKNKISHYSEYKEY